MATIRAEINGRARRLAKSTEEIAVFEKDILRLGRWQVPGSGTWEVTHDTLGDLVAAFEQARRLGFSIPVVWDHSNSARDNVGTIRRLWVEGDTLSARFEITEPEAIRKLGRSIKAVSVEVADDFRDGQGNRYPVFLVHLGLVQHGVVTGQGDFRRVLSMANQGFFRSITGKPAGKRRQLQAEGEVSGDEPGMPGAGEFDADFLRNAINALLMAAGSDFEIPDDTTPDNFNDRLAFLVKMATKGQKSAASDESAAIATEDVAEAIGEELSAASMSLKTENTELRRQLSALAAARETEAEKAFADRLDGLIESGRVAPVFRKSLENAGKAAKWSLALLDPFADASPQKRSPRSRLLGANFDEKPNGDETDEERRARAKRFISGR
jgi:hypothetical protein